MNNSKSEAVVVQDGDKLFVVVETNEEGLKDFRESSKYKDLNAEICTMWIEGEKKPAFRFEVKDPEWYQDYMQDQWKHEAAWKMEQRCVICGENGKSKRCPLRVKNPDYHGQEGVTKTIAVRCEECPVNRQFRPVKGTVFFSSLELRDSEGNIDPYEPESGRYSPADDYLKLLKDFIEYVRTHYPRYAHYCELLEILGQEVEMKEAAARMKRPDKTLYGWLKRLRPIFDEFRDSVDYL